MGEIILIWKREAENPFFSPNRQFPPSIFVTHRDSQNSPFPLARLHNILSSLIASKLVVKQIPSNVIPIHHQRVKESTWNNLLPVSHHRPRPVILPLIISKTHGKTCSQPTPNRTKKNRTSQQKNLPPHCYCHVLIQSLLLHL